MKVGDLVKTKGGTIGIVIEKVRTPHGDRCKMGCQLEIMDISGFRPGVSYFDYESNTRWKVISESA